MTKESQCKRGMTGYALKWVAIISMLIDHIGYVLLSPVLVESGIYSVSNLSPAYIKGLFEQGSIGWVYLAYLLMRTVIGRVAFPIFCFLLTEGFLHTGNKKKYAGRLFLFCFLSEVPFDLVFFGQVWYPERQNVFITLLIGYLCIWWLDILEKKAYEKASDHQMAIPAVILVMAISALLACALADGLQSDYGYKGILAILALYICRRDRKVQLLMCGITFLWEPTALLALIPMGMYNGKKGKGFKYFFYLFYPLHLLALYAIKMLWFS